jgi:hypothetical protein
MIAHSDDRVAFGRMVLGPIFADFALRLWMLLSGLESKDQAVLLFCARGGLRLRVIYDRFLAASGLASPVATRDLMVSRVIAVRVALSTQCPSAYEQIAYEMGAVSLRQVASAIGGIDCTSAEYDDPAWGEPYSQAGFAKLLASEDGQAVHANIKHQAALFRTHLNDVLGGRTRPILCDTGLSGSTMRLLEDGLPHLHWGCALFARSNYKNLSTSHYSRTAGLSVESDRYSPLDKRTAILRYWHLIESTLEPELSSVSTFTYAGDSVTSNLEIPDWQSRVHPAQGEIFAGVIDYIDGLPKGRAAATILSDVDQAYTRLRQAVIRPTRADVAMLNIGSRSLDFGRTHDMTGPACEPGIRKALRGSLWREGAVSLASASLRWPVLTGIEAAYVARWAFRSLRARSSVS